MKGNGTRSRANPAFRQIADDLEQRILAGELPIGSTLPGEQTLAGLFGVSRPTVREAIRALEQMGLLARMEGRNKLAITIPHVDDIGARMHAAFVLRETTFEQLWEAMIAIEPKCAEAAARQASDDDISLIADNVKRTRAALFAQDDLVELDIEFHALVAESAHNGALQLSRKAIGELFYPAFSRVMTRLNVGERLLQSHESILAAIRDRDGAKAREWMERHITDFKRGWELAGLDLGEPVRELLEKPAALNE